MQLTLRQHRRRAYLTVRELARRAGVSTDTIWRIQKGERPKPATIWKIARVLNVHPDEVVEFSRAALPVDGAVVSDFEAAHDLWALAAQQGVQPVADPSSLLGDFWPEEETTKEFIEALREWRRELDGPLPTST